MDESTGTVIRRLGFCLTALINGIMVEVFLINISTKSRKLNTFLERPLIVSFTRDNYSKLVVIMVNGVMFKGTAYSCWIFRHFQQGRQLL